MKRLKGLLVILLLVSMMFSISAVALAQGGDPTAEPTTEPTAEPATGSTVEPTTEPTAEPTVEPTTEPTAEPTVEPTTEPTTEPTAEPTVEPTTEPTAEPTVQPTTEPTAEPTVEPTTEPTAEPTVEPTLDLPVINSFAADPITGTAAFTTTLSWDVTNALTLTLNGEDVTGLTGQDVAVTETTVYTLTAENDAGSVQDVVTAIVEAPVAVAAIGTTEGEIGSSAAVGTWTTQYFGVQNLSTTSPANVSVELYTGGNTSPAQTLSSPTIPSIPVGTGIHVDLSSVADGQYSGIVLSDAPVAVSLLTLNSSYKAGDGYLGFDSNMIAEDLIFPVVFRQTKASVNSKFWIQDASGQGQSFVFSAFVAGSSTAAVTKTYTVSANNTVTIDFGTSSDFAAFGTGFGYAKVESNDGRVLAGLAQTLQDQNTGTANVLEKYYPGLPIPPAGTSRTLIAPTLYKNLQFIADSAMTIVNTENAPTTLTYTYVAFGPGNVPLGTFIATRNVAANASQPFYLPGQAELPNNSFGSISVTSSDTDILAIASSNQLREGNRVGWEIPAVNPSQGKTKLAMPVSLKTGSAYNKGWQTLATIYTVGSAGTITTTWVRAGAAASPVEGVDKFTITKAGTTNGSQVFYTPSAALSSVPTDFQGVIFIESGGNQLVGELIQHNYVSGFAGGHQSYGYD